MKKITVFALFLFGVFSLVSTHAQLEAPAKDYVTNVDKMPKLKGSKGSFSQYIAKKIDYPEALKVKGIEGDVWISFIVTKDGKVSQMKVDKSVHPLLDQVVVDFVANTGKWKPGVLNGEKVNTRMEVPVKFSLTPSERQLASQIRTFEQMTPPPLFILDNKEVRGVMRIEDYNVASIRVIKGEKALKLYGERAKNGVVVITSKRGTPPLY